MPDRRDKAYLQPYREAVAHFGPGFEATLWNSREAQMLRFDVMRAMASFDGAVILDVGCGQGDLGAHLVELEVPFERYVGLDALAEMIEAARRRRIPRSEFHVTDVVAEPEALATPGPDYVCFSGTLNTMDEGTAREVVGAGYDAAARGVVFNFLSTRHHPRWSAVDPTPARRFDPLRWIDFALGLSSRVKFDQSYLDGHDATIVIEKGS